MIIVNTNRTSTRTSTTGTSPERYLDQLAHLVAAHGITAFEGDIARLVVRLRAQGHRGTLVDVLGDHQAPGVARERALGCLLGALARGPAQQRRAAA